MDNLVFIRLYKQYIEANRATFEINISSDNRSRMESYYLLIQRKLDQHNQNCENGNTDHEFIIDKATFVQMWIDLLRVCDELCYTLYAAILWCNALTATQLRE